MDTAKVVLRCRDLCPRAAAHTPPTLPLTARPTQSSAPDTLPVGPATAAVAAAACAAPTAATAAHAAPAQPAQPAAGGQPSAQRPHCEPCDEHGHQQAGEEEPGGDGHCSGCGPRRARARWRLLLAPPPQAEGGQRVPEHGEGDGDDMMPVLCAEQLESDVRALLEESTRWCHEAACPRPNTQCWRVSNLRVSGRRPRRCEASMVAYKMKERSLRLWLARPTGGRPLQGSRRLKACGT